MKKMNAWICLVLSICMLAGCSSAPPKNVNAKTTGVAPSLLVDAYLIGVDDQVQVSVWKNPDLSLEVPVRPDGRISVPLVGEVLAGGRKPEDVAAEITEKLSAYIRNPQVTVILTEVRSHEFLSRVRVSGAVQTPRSMTFRPGMTVLDLVLEAGGLSDFASGNSAKLYRQSQTGVQTIRVRVKDMVNRGEMDTNYLIQPGDILSIPERIL